MTSAPTAIGRRIQVAALVHWPLLTTLVLGVGYMVALTLLHSHAVSPIDESQYLDYLDKVYSQGLVRQGEHIGLFTRELFACHGIIAVGRMGPECGTDLSDPSRFPFAGLNSAPNYTPLQFWIWRVVGDGLGLVPGVDRIAGWRLVSSLWLAGGLVFAYLAARRLRLAGAVYAIVALAVVASPFGFWTFSFVSTDAPVWFLGALSFWLVLRLAARESSAWWLVLLGAVGALFKPTMLVAVGFAFLYLLIRRILEAQRRRAGAGPVLRDPVLWIALGAVVANLAVSAAWTRAVPLLAVSDQAADLGVQVPFTLGIFARQFLEFLNGLLQSVVPGPDDFVLLAPFNLFAVAAAVGAVLLWRRGARDQATPIALLTTLLVAGPVLTLLVGVSTGMFFPIPPRYSMAVIPVLVVVAVPLMRNVWAQRILAGYVAVVMAYYLVWSVFIAGQWS